MKYFRIFILSANEMKLSQATLRSGEMRRSLLAIGIISIQQILSCQENGVIILTLHSSTSNLIEYSYEIQTNIIWWSQKLFYLKEYYTLYITTCTNSVVHPRYTISKSMTSIATDQERMDRDALARSPSSVCAVCTRLHDQQFAGFCVPPSGHSPMKRNKMMRNKMLKLFPISTLSFSLLQWNKLPITVRIKQLFKAKLLFIYQVLANRAQLITVKTFSNISNPGWQY